MNGQTATAKYQCLRCGLRFSHTWIINRPPSDGECAACHCPACRHLYLKWLNYEADFAKKS